MPKSPIQYTSGNQLTLHKNGEQFFPALLSAIATAKHEVRIETYIFELDEIGGQFVAALIEARSRNVCVYLLIDGIGSRGFRPSIAAQLVASGVQLLVYRPDVSPFHLGKNRLRRLHRKVATIDATVAFVGGINIVSDFAPPNKEHPQFDFSVGMQGPIVAHVYASTTRIWRMVALTQPLNQPTHSARQGVKKMLTGLRSNLLRVLAPKVVSTQPSSGSSAAAFVFRDNFRNRRAIEQMYLDALHDARSEIILANAYFLPGLKLRAALKAASDRGVRVTLLLQGYTDHRLLKIATHALYDSLLAQNIHIIEYERSMLHAKACVVDRSWATVGSSNLDPFSLLLAREANIATTDTALAQQLHDELIREIEIGGKAYTRELWANRSLGARLLSWSVFGLARFVMGIVGLGRGLN